MYDQARRSEVSVEAADTSVDTSFQDFGSNEDQIARLPSLESGNGGLLDSLLGSNTEVAAPFGSGMETGETPTTTIPGVTVVVAVDTAFDARKMRDAILRGPPFLFTQAEVAKLTAEDDALFYLVDKSTPGTPATADQVKTWGKAGSLLSIAIPADRVSALFHFLLRQRLPGLRDGLPAALGLQMVDLVIRCLVGDAGAAVGLADLARTESLVARKIQAVADGDLGARSPALQVAAAQVLTNGQVQIDEKLIGPPSEDRALLLQDIEARLTRATELAANGDRVQAAKINDDAAEMYRRLGLTVQAEQRARVARMFRSTPQERSSVGGLIPQTVPGTTSMSATTKEQQALYKFYAENPTLNPMNRDVRQRFEIGAKADQEEPQISAKVNEQANQRRQQNGVRTTTRVPVPTGGQVEANQRGLIESKQAGGAVNLVQQWNIWMTAWAKMMALARKLAELDKLQRDALRSTSYDKPPSVADVQLARKQLDAAVGATPPIEIRDRVADARAKLAFLEELSRAFWP